MSGQLHHRLPVSPSPRLPVSPSPCVASHASLWVIGQIVKPWAHNPQAIHAADPDHGHIYALYTLGDGVPESGPQHMCNNTPPHAVLDTGKDGSMVAAAAATTGPGPVGGGGGRNITANFTIHWSVQPEGPYQEHVAQIVNWPSNWQYGAHGNWNPAPMVQ